MNAGIVRDSVFMETFLDEEEVGQGAGVKTAADEVSLIISK